MSAARAVNPEIHGYDYGSKSLPTSPVSLEELRALEQAAPVVPLRYLIAFSAITSTTIRPFLEKSARSGEEIQRVCDAWLKSMLVHLALWARPYVPSCLW